MDSADSQVENFHFTFNFPILLFVGFVFTSGLLDHAMGKREAGSGKPSVVGIESCDTKESFCGWAVSCIISWGDSSSCFRTDNMNAIHISLEVLYHRRYVAYNVFRMNRNS